MRTPGRHRRPGRFTARRRSRLGRGLRTPSAWASSVVLLLVVAAVLGSPAGRTADLGLNAYTGRPPTTMVRVIGYPNGQDRPVTCQNWTIAISGTQQRFDCGGFTDGTSGGPFLADAGDGSAEGIVVGVIDGYQRGGDTPEISYSPMFGTNVAALYRSAIAVS